MGDLLDGIFSNLGVSGGQNTVKVTPTYLGQNEFQNPLEDIMGLLASEANQQRAQRNLLFGGGGYGGSFETAAQKAQRAAGQPVDNSKPFGGWGGYGSNNPVMAWDPTGTRPDWMNQVAPPPAGQAPPPGGGGNGTTPIPPRDTPPTPPVSLPPTRDDFGDAPMPPGGALPPRGTPGTVPTDPRTGGTTPPVTTPPTRGNFGDMEGFLEALRAAMAPSGTDVAERAGATVPAASARGVTGLTPERAAGLREVYKGQGMTPDQVEAAIKAEDTRVKAAQSKQVAAGIPKQGTSAYLDWARQNSIADLKRQGRTQEAAQLEAETKSPAYKGFREIQEFLYQKGDQQGVRQPDVEQALAAGLTVDDLKKHYGTILDTYGPRAFHYGHTTLGQLNDLSPEGIARIKSGAAAQDAIKAGVDQGLTPGTAKPPTRSAMTEEAGAKVAAGGKVAAAPGDAEADVTHKTWGFPKKAAEGDIWTPPTGGTYTFQGGVWVDGNGYPVAGQPGNSGGGGSAPTGGGATGGGNGGPPGGDNGYTGSPTQGVMSWDRFIKVLQYWHPEMSVEELTDKYKSWYEDGLLNGFDEAWQSDPRFQELMDRYNPPENPSDEPQRPSQFGPQGFNPTQVQKRDAQGKLMFDPTTGDPIMEDIDPSQATDGSGYAVGDAWSTSPLWRPEEPTGGLYGAYSEMAGGQLTPYENRIMEGWQGRAANPMGWADEKTLASIDNYEKTPGRGEDEAYGAYNTMLQGGYSPEEQNAITQEGMRAARAGYETNRDAMLRNQARTGNAAGYAANMAKMARGFGETMGSQARQNQILFADETQKRRETGAGGMLNVAGLANQRGQASIAARSGFGNEMARRQETGLQGMQASAGYGRDLQKQGLAGLHALYQGSDPTAAWGQAAEIGSKPRETWTKTGGTSGGV